MYVCIYNTNMKFGSSMLGCFNPSSKPNILARNEGEESVFHDFSPLRMLKSFRLSLCKLNPRAGGDTATNSGETLIRNSDLRIFSYDELKAATQGFAHKIGQGGLGSVYKGRLVGDDFIAVKVLSVELESLRGEREFISEIIALSYVKHENLVTLRGCCINGADRFLVYDFIENNSLNHTFFGCDQKRVEFTWTLRKQVSLGIARGLCYLHQEISPYIVHRDIKASNILLDQNFAPKIADFGLAKLFRDNTSHISTRVAGTLGYLSPEYAHSGHLTRKSDVYSFGVLLLEIVSGRPVVDYHLKHGEQFIVEKAWGLYNSKNLREMVDIVIEKNCSGEATRFLKVGLLCVQERAKLRPEMSTVVKMLRGEIDTENVEISLPGIVAHFKDIKVRQKHSSIFSLSSRQRPLLQPVGNHHHSWLKSLQV